MESTANRQLDRRGMPRSSEGTSTMMTDKRRIACLPGWLMRDVARTSRMTAGSWRLLAALALHANSKGRCFVSSRTLANYGIAWATLERARSLLVELKVIVIEDPGDRHRAARYQILQVV